MKINVRGWLSGVALASALLLAACGGGGDGGTASGGGALNVTTPGEQLAFQPATLTATAGQQVSVSFKNGSAAQKHNWVLVKDDAAANTVSTAAAGNNGEPPAGPDVLGKVSTAAPGATSTGNFTAPAAGSYVFLCTEPGHYAAGMKCTLTVS